MHQYKKVPLFSSSVGAPPYMAKATPILMSIEPTALFNFGYCFFTQQYTNILAGDDADLENVKYKVTRHI